MCKYGSDFYNDVKRHLDNVDEYITQVRRLAANGLLYNEGEPYSGGAALENAVTFFNNVGIIPLAHFNEQYIAWMKAIENADCRSCASHYIKNISGEDATCEKDGTAEHWVYHDSSSETQDRYFDDKYLSKELSESDLVIEAMGHDWGPWKIVKAATTKEEGLKQRVCKNDSNHVEDMKIPKLEEDDNQANLDDITKGTSTSTSTTNSNASSSAVPKSGDETNLLLWLGLIAISLLGATLVKTVYKRN